MPPQIVDDDINLPRGKLGELSAQSRVIRSQVDADVRLERCQRLRITPGGDHFFAPR